MTQQEFGLY